MSEVAQPRSPWPTRLIWSGVGFALGIGATLIWFVALWGFAAARNATDSSDQWDTRMATAIHRAMALVDGTPPGAALPPPRDDMVVLQVIDAEGTPVSPETYFLWSLSATSRGRTAYPIWFIRITGTGTDVSWEIGDVSQRLAQDMDRSERAHIRINLDEMTLRLLSTEKPLEAWFGHVYVTGSKDEWKVIHAEPGVWPYD